MGNSRQAFERSLLLDRVAARHAAEHEDVSVKNVKYSDGSLYQFGTFKKGDEYGVEIKTPRGIYTCKKTFADKGKADKYVAKFADRADGKETLEKVLSKDYTRAGAHKNAGEFTPAEWEAHKKEHPGADRSDHTITKKVDRPKRKTMDEYDMHHDMIENPRDHGLDPNNPEDRKTIKNLVKQIEQVNRTRGEGGVERNRRRAPKPNWKAAAAFEHALMVERVAGEFTPAEWESYKKKHPGANRSDHTIKKEKVKRKPPSEIDVMREQLEDPKHYDLDDETIAHYKKQVEQHDSDKARDDKYEKLKKKQHHHRDDDEVEFMEKETKRREDERAKEQKLRSGG